MGKGRLPIIGTWANGFYLMGFIIFAGIVGYGILGMAGVNLPTVPLPFSSVTTNADLNPPQGTEFQNAPAGDCVLSATQTMGIGAYDFDKNSALSPSTTVYLDPASGSLNPTNNDTTPYGKYYVYNTVSNYLGAVKEVTTDCQVSVPVTTQHKAVDTSVTMTGYNTDGITKNTGSGGSTNLSIGTGGSATLHMHLQQSANYKHIGGVNGEFAVFLNATNSTDWDTAEMSVSFDGVECSAYTSYNYDGTLKSAVQPNALGGVMVKAWNCKGDFLTSDGGIHDLAVKYQAQSSVNPANQITGISIVPLDYYQNTITNALEYGAVKNSGAAIQTLQTEEVDVG